MSKKRFSFFASLALLTLGLSLNTAVGLSQWDIRKDVISATIDAVSSKVGDKAVAYLGNRYFTTVESAVNAANSISGNQNVYVIPGTNPIITSSFTINSNVTLNLPYSGTSIKTYTLNGAKTDSFKAPSTNRKSFVKVGKTLSNNIVIINNGTIKIGGNISGGGGGQTWNSNTGGDYAELCLYGDASLISNGTIECYGYITGSSSSKGVYLKSGSQTTGVFSIREHRGGTIFRNMYGNLKAPAFNRWYIATFLDVDYEFEYGSIFKGFCDLYASYSHNTTTIDLLSFDTSNSLISLSSGCVLHGRMSSSTTISQYDFYGSFNLNALSLYVVVVTVSTQSVEFPLSWYQNITLNEARDGTKAIVSSARQSIKLLPSSSLIINSNVSVSIPNIAVYDSFTDVNVGNGTPYQNDKKTDPAQLIVNGSLTADSLGGVITPTETGGSIYFKNNSYTTHELSATNPTYTALTFNAKGPLYGKSGNVTLYSDSVYKGHEVHWDGNGASYPLEVINIKSGDIAFDETLISNNDYPEVIETSINLPTPVYDGDYVFFSYFCEPEFLNPVSPGQLSAGKLGASFDLNEHKYVLYARWILNTAEKVKYRVDRYDGASTITEGDTVELLIGESFSEFEDDVRATTFTTSKISMHRYNGWLAKIYDNDSNSKTLIETKKVDLSVPFEFTNENGVYGDNFVVFEPDYITTEAIAPEITVETSVATIPTSKTSDLKATVTNYDPETFGYLGLFVSEDESNVTVSTDLEPKISGNVATFTGKATNMNTSGSSTGTTTIRFGLNVTVVVDGVSYASSGSTLYYGSVSQSYNKSCLLPDTMILMADGTKKMVKDIVVGDIVLALNYETGQYEPAPVIFNNHYSQESQEYEILNLLFDRGFNLEIVGNHGLFDATLRKFVFLDSNNYHEYIGHEFIVTNGMTNSTTILIDGEIYNKVTKVYSPITYFYMNIVADDMLTVGPPVTEDGRTIEGFVNYFEFNADASWNQEAKARDLAMYGTYSPEDFADYISAEAFWSSPGVYLKAAVGKGIMTYQDIVDVIEYLLKRGLIEGSNNN